MAKKTLANLGVNVGVDMKAFDKAMDRIFKTLGKLTKPVVVKVQGDSRGIDKVLSAVVKKAQSLKSVKVAVSANTSPASKAINALKSQIQKLQNTKIKINATVNTPRISAGAGRAAGVGIGVSGGGGGGRGRGGPGIGNGVGIGTNIGGIGIGDVVSPQVAGVIGLGRAMGGTVQVASSLESLLIKLRKASDQGDEGFNALRDGLYKLSLEMHGITTKELLEIATTGAKLGIAAPDLIEYSKGIAMVASAMDDIPAAQIADEIGKLNVVFDLGVKGTQQLGSAIDKVADSGVSSASGILNVTQRVSGAAKASKISAQEAIAFGAALLDTGSHAEIASTSLLRMFQTINNVKSQAGYAKVLGISAEEFAKTVREKPTQAIIQFLEKVRAMDSGSQQNAFKAIGVDGLQAIGELQKLTSQLDSVKRYIGMANEEFQTLNQLNASYAMTAGSAEATTANFKNQITLLSNKIGSALLPLWVRIMGIGGRLAEFFSRALDSVAIGGNAVYEALKNAVGSDIFSQFKEFASLYEESFVGGLEASLKVIRNLPDYITIMVLSFMDKFNEMHAKLEWFGGAARGIFFAMFRDWKRTLDYMGQATKVWIKNNHEDIKDLLAWANPATALWRAFQGRPVVPDEKPIEMPDAKKFGVNIPDFHFRAANTEAIQELFDKIEKAEAEREKARQKAIDNAKKPAPPPGQEAQDESFAADAKKKKSSGGFKSLEEFYKDLQMGIGGKKKDPTQESILGQHKQENKKLDELVAIAKKPPGAAAAPAAPAAANAVGGAIDQAAKDRAAMFVRSNLGAPSRASLLKAAGMRTVPPAGTPAETPAIPAVAAGVAVPNPMAAKDRRRAELGLPSLAVPALSAPFGAGEAGVAGGALTAAQKTDLDRMLDLGGFGKGAGLAGREGPKPARRRRGRAQYIGPIGNFDNLAAGAAGTGGKATAGTGSAKTAGDIVSVLNATNSKLDAVIKNTAKPGVAVAAGPA